MGGNNGGGYSFGQRLMAAGSSDPMGTFQKIDATNQAKAVQSDLVNYTGGYDPKTGINWATGRQTPDNPMAEMSKDPMMGIFARTNPQQFLSTVATQIMAPPKPYQITTPEGTSQTRLFTAPQAMAWQAANPKGSIVGSDNAKPLDPNTPVQTAETYQGGYKQEMQRTPGTNTWAPLGGRGAPAVLPQSDLGKLAFDMNNGFMGGGSFIPGQQGSGAHPNSGTGTVPAASPVTQSGPSSFGPPPTSPALAQPFRAGISALAPDGSIPQTAAQTSMGSSANPGGSGIPSQAGFNDLFRAALQKPIVEAQQSQLNLQKTQQEVDAAKAKNAFTTLPPNLYADNPQPGKLAYNDEYIQNLPPQSQARFSSLPPEIQAQLGPILSGKTAPPESGRAMTDPILQNVLRSASLVDPNFNEQTWRARNKQIQDLASHDAASAGGQKIAAQTLTEHLFGLADAAADNKNNSWAGTPGNWVDNFAVGAFPPGAIGNSAAKKGNLENFRVHKIGVGEEGTKVQSGSAGTDSSKAEMAGRFSEDADISSNIGAIGGLADMMQQRVQSQVDKHNSIMGTHVTVADWLGPDAMKKYGALQQLSNDMKAGKRVDPAYVKQTLSRAAGGQAGASGRWDNGTPIPPGSKLNWTPEKGLHP